MKPFFTIDFEASCLPAHGRSYPIEVGIADTSGRSRAWLIKPIPEWRYWTWTDEAQGLHRITRAELENDGHSPLFVLDALCEEIAGSRAFADSYLDRQWLTTLATAAGKPSPFAIEHVSDYLEEKQTARETIERAEVTVNRAGLSRHRAADDARYLSLLLNEIERENPIERQLFKWKDPQAEKRSVTVAAAI